MNSTTFGRHTRSGLIGIVLATLLLGAQGVAQAAMPIGGSGAHGSYSIVDTSADPGTRCRYDGAAGTWYLQRIHVPAPTIFGASAQPRSVGYRLLLQQRTTHGWKTVQRGTLVSGVADTSTAATLTGSTVVRDPDVAPNWPRYRAALKLIWWDAHAQVQGTQLLAIEHHRRTFDGSVGLACPGRVPIG
jgi:hypothetical protein